MQKLVSEVTLRIYVYNYYILDTTAADQPVSKDGRFETEISASFFPRELKTLSFLCSKIRILICFLLLWGFSQFICTPNEPLKIRSSSSSSSKPLFVSAEKMEIKIAQQKYKILKDSRLVFGVKRKRGTF